MGEGNFFDLRGSLSGLTQVGRFMALERGRCVFGRWQGRELQGDVVLCADAEQWVELKRSCGGGGA
jgi:hypothetical protein